MKAHSNSEFQKSQAAMTDDGLQRILSHLTRTIERDELVQRTTHQLREALQVDRVVLYYFYSEWQGQVTFESISSESLSILGSKGPEDCFNSGYAERYLAGRVRAIADIEVEVIAECHRDFLRGLQVRANLAVPILAKKGLWGLLIAHHCQGPRPWTETDIEQMRSGAASIANAPSVQDY